MPARPNLLFVFADQLRARELDDPTHPLLTPAYDRLRAEGSRCPNTVANCPVCTPSRGILLTGQYPFSNRVLCNDLPLPESAVTVGDVLQAAGYRTGYIGKWHLDGVPRAKFTPPGLRRHGFQTWAVHNCIHRYLDSAYYGDTPELRPIPGYEPEFQTDLACEFLAEGGEQPFCLFLSWGPPHNPFEQVPRWYQGLYPPEALALPGNLTAPDRLAHNPDYPPNALQRLDDPRLALSRYYAAITALDQQLMRLLEKLDQRDLAANTVVVYTSDHGELLWSHGRLRKQQPWDEAVRVPFVIRWPEAIPAGVDRPGCLSLVDLAPTLLSLLGCEVPAAMEGSDLAAYLRAETEQAPSSSFIMDLMPVDEGLAQNLRPWRGVRTARHTYARWLDGRCWLLYDNLADPDQRCNLAELPEHSGLRSALEAELQGWMRRAGDDGLPGEELLRRLGLARLWNDRERELHGSRARLLEEDR
ncbi:MAG: sulfatase [Armatimonadetes bacterium]|nr:sulfatase [Armatimonadota bacterium]